MLKFDAGDISLYHPQIKNANVEWVIYISPLKIIDGAEACTVGFIPRAYAKMENIRRKIGSFAFVLELYDISSNKYKRRLSKRNYGVASCLFIDELPVPQGE